MLEAGEIRPLRGELTGDPDLGPVAGTTDAGDVVEVAVSGIGTLRNPVALR